MRPAPPRTTASGCTEPAAAWPRSNSPWPCWELRATGLLLTPLVPARSIVPGARLACDWLGHYEKREPVASAYADLAGLIFERITA